MMVRRGRIVRGAALSLGLALACTRAAPIEDPGLPDIPIKLGETIKRPSGLEFTSLREGFGDRPTARSTVRVHYKGTLEDGTVFDSSFERGQPSKFPLDRVIRCWTEGFQLMRSGSKSRLVCPSRIAYGSRGRPPKIPPGATLIFEVELLEVL